MKDIPEDVARKAKYMIVSLPANPVGSVGSPALYAELVAFAKKYDILIIHDNAYSDIIFDGAVGNSFFNTPGAMDVAWSSSACPKASTSPVHASAFLWAGGTW